MSRTQDSTTTPLLGDENQHVEPERRRRNYGSSSSSDVTNHERIEPQFDNHRSTLSFMQKIGFGLGHVYNDLCAGVWFSYTLLFMQKILSLPPIVAGALVMLGQVGDALATPIIGLLTDRFGTKRQWHVAGTLLVFLSFPMIFSLCPWCTTSQKWWPPLYFGIFIILFQFAWACVQITHMAMISEMSLTQQDRSDLTSVRYAGSVCSSVIVYVITWFMLRSHSGTNNGTSIGPKDAFRFRDISLILTLIGTTMTVLFHFSLALSGYERRRQCFLSVANQSSEEQQQTHEKNDENDEIEETSCKSEMNKLRKPLASRINFFKTKELYQNGCTYVFARLFMTTSMVYFPLWLDERGLSPNNSTETLNKFSFPNENVTLRNLTPMTPVLFQIKDIVTTSSVEHLATVPLVLFLSSFITSVGTKKFNKLVGHKIFYFIGSVIGFIACFWIAIINSSEFTTERLYTIAVFFGAASSITMISSICIIADMIGGHVYQGGFIYSVVTFADKFITGIVIVIIESLKCAKPSECPQYYKEILSYGCGIASLLGILILLSTLCNKKRNELSNRNSSNVVIT